MTTYTDISQQSTSYGDISALSTSYSEQARRTIPFYFLLEDGSRFLLEDGCDFLLESTTSPFHEYSDIIKN